MISRSVWDGRGLTRRQRNTGADERRGQQVRPERRLRTAVRTGLVTTAMAALVAGGAGTTLASQSGGEGSSPARGHAAVVAQQIIDLPSGQLGWQVTRRTASPADADAAALFGSADAAGFVVADDGALLVSVEGGPRVRLASGEALAVEAGAEVAIAATGDDEAEFYTLGLGRGTAKSAAIDRAGATVGDPTPFATPGGAARDMDLLRDVLAADEESELPAGAGPTLLLVTEGTLEVATPNGGSIEIAAGDATTLEGDLALTAADEGAAFVAAVLGAEVDADEASASPTYRTGSGTGGGTGGGGGAGTGGGDRTGTGGDGGGNGSGGGSGGGNGSGNGGQATASATETAGATKTPTATPTAQPDTDADDDGLSDDDEALRGTDPNLADTDGDGLLDGREVFETGTDPLNADSDADGITDGEEVDTYGSNPSSNDGDGDGLPDYNEIFQHGTDPNEPDTDGDGISDHDELN